jgi:type IV secretory pathway VirD2 relaxase
MSDRNPAFRTREARIQVKIMRLRWNGLRAARDHLRYIERDGVTRSGERAIVYSATENGANGREFLNRCRDDRHQFRITASAKDGDQYEDLKPLIRRFMSRVEDDLGTNLDWVAADHADTPHPHTHLLLRGRDDCGNDLVIAPNYVYYAMRERLGGIVSLDLGPVTGTERARSLLLEVEAERVTSLDRRLLREMDEAGAITIASENMVEHSLLTARLHKLGALGLASPLTGGRWRVAEDLEDTLHTLDDCARMARILKQRMAAAGLVRAPTEQVVHHPDASLDIAGRLVTRGLVSGVPERQYWIVDAVDGRSHYVETVKNGSAQSVRDDAVVRLTFSEEHARASGERSVQVEILSPSPLHELPRYEGPTWLDRELLSPQLVPRDLGFGRELRSAMADRRNWLIEHGFASTSNVRLTYRADMLSVLQERELVRTANVLTRETGHVFATIEDERSFHGIVRRRIDLAGSRYAMIDNGFEFTLVPWQPAFEQALGKPVRAMVGATGLSWTFYRGRELEI